MPPLDGLRGLAVLLVMLFHYGTMLDSHYLFQSGLMFMVRLGWTGVDLFFVLSGFLITGILRTHARRKIIFHPSMPDAS